MSGSATRSARGTLSRLWEQRSNRVLLLLAALFLAAYLLPLSSPRVGQAIHESVLMFSEYAREHVLTCLVPAFFIAGAITLFLNHSAVIRYLGPDAPKPVAYGVASVSGTVLSVCSCTVLPLFKGIYGIIVGGLNISLARAVVGRRLHTFAERMRTVTQKFRYIK